MKIDQLVRGKAGTTERIVEGRVFHIARSGAVAIIGSEDHKQWYIYDPEVVGDPRPVISRGDIPQRLRP